MNRFLLAASLLLLPISTIFAAPTSEPIPPDVFGKAKTIHVLAVRYQNDVEKEVSEAWLAKPNKAYIEDTNRQVGGITIVYVSDGKTQTEYRQSAGKATRASAPAHFADIHTPALALRVLRDIFTPNGFARLTPGPKNDAVTQYSRHFSGNGTPAPWTTWTIDRHTGLPKSVWFTSQPMDALTSEDEDESPEDRKKCDPQDQRVDFHNWVLNAPISPRKFRYTPPSK